jgi:peptide deformylase
MPVKEVLMLGNPRLREMSSDVTDFESELQAGLEDLKDTLAYLQETRKIGRALAAPQIGWMKKVVYAQLPDRTVIMVNPEVVWKSEEMFEVWDSCFSFDVAFFVKVRRHRKIRVKYLDEAGSRSCKEFAGDLSELFQHEIDHLYGVLATDHLEDCRQILMRAEWEKICGNG